MGEYPVPYFFYGSLVDPLLLVEMLALPSPAVLKEAKVRGGQVMCWSGQQCVLIDACKKETVEGWVFVVENKEWEDKLLMHEGANYEVVRCKIEVKGEEARDGLTFRFCGERSTLREVEVGSEFDFV